METTKFVKTVRFDVAELYVRLEVESGRIRHQAHLARLRRRVKDAMVAVRKVAASHMFNLDGGLTPMFKNFLESNYEYPADLSVFTLV